MKIRLAEPMAAGAPFVAPVLLRKLRALPKDPVGAHTLTALGITIRIAVDVGAVIGSPPDGTAVCLHALEITGAFPIFNGTIRVEPVDVFSSRVVLSGTYQVPLGSVGAAADRTVLAGAAKRSLRALMKDIRDDVAASVLASVTGG
jgi:hypothetical protein